MAKPQRGSCRHAVTIMSLMPLLFGVMPSTLSTTAASPSASSCSAVLHVNWIACVASRTAGQVVLPRQPEKLSGCVSGHPSLQCLDSQYTVSRWPGIPTAYQHTFAMAWLTSSKMTPRGNLGVACMSLTFATSAAASVPNFDFVCLLFSHCIARQGCQIITWTNCHSATVGPGARSVVYGMAVHGVTSEHSCSVEAAACHAGSNAL